MSPRDTVRAEIKGALFDVQYGKIDSMWWPHIQSTLSTMPDFQKSADITNYFVVSNFIDRVTNDIMDSKC